MDFLTRVPQLPQEPLHPALRPTKRKDNDFHDLDLPLDGGLLPAAIMNGQVLAAPAPSAIAWQAATPASLAG